MLYRDDNLIKLTRAAATAGSVQRMKLNLQVSEKVKIAQVGKVLKFRTRYSSIDPRR